MHGIQEDKAITNESKQPPIPGNQNPCPLNPNPPFGDYKRKDAEHLSPLVLAFTGDAVYNLYVRARITANRDLTPNALHRLCAKHVCAKAQAQAADRLLPTLTPAEAEIFRRGKNAKPGTIPKNADPGDYAKATALEAVIGWLFLRGCELRVGELLDAAFGA